MRRFLLLAKRQIRTLAAQITIVLAALLLPLNILYLDATQQYINNLTEQSIRNTQNLISYRLDLLRMRMQSANQYVQRQFLKADADLRAVLAQNDRIAYLLARNSLLVDFNITNRVNPSADIFFIYSPKLNDFQMTYLYPFVFDKASLSESIHEHIDDFYSAFWKPIFFDDSVFIAHTFQSYGMYLGTVIRVDETVESIRQESHYASSRIFLSDTRDVDQGDLDFKVTQAFPGVSGLYLHYMVSQEDIYGDIPHAQRTMLKLAYFYIGLIPFLVLILYLWIGRPMNGISQALAIFQNGDRNYRIKRFSRASDLKDIQVSFNAMAKRIDRLISESYEQQILQQKIQLDNYHLMIRPHFLLNTFCLLYTMSQCGETEELGDFILYLSNYFRSNYKGVQSLSPLSQELELINTYVEIAKIQYPNRIEYHTSVDESLLSFQVPSLLVHNFIENSISHGLTEQKVLSIFLTIQAESGYLHLNVSDDGGGILPDRLLRINEGQSFSTDGHEHIGLHNTYCRLQLIYKGRARFEVQSTPCEGTSVHVWIPLKEEGALANETTNRE